VSPVRRAWLAALLGSCCAGAFAADLYPEAVVEVVLNGQPDPQSLIVRRSATGQLLLRESDLAALRLRPGTASTLEIDGTRYVALADDPRVQVVFDEVTQRATITAAPELFLPTHRASLHSSLPDVSPAAPGGFLNYDFSATDDGRSQSVGAFFEAGYFDARGVLTSSALVNDDGGERRAARLETTWSHDMPERLATLRLGDTISASGAWSHSVRLAGVQFGTNFLTQPTLITTPLMTASGSAVVPSTVDVFVNGRQIASEAVPPGPFTLERLPAITGAGEMQVVVTDALGRQQVLAQPYYSGNELLREGLDAYSFELGSLRESYGSVDDRYDGWVASGTWRRGFTPAMTLGAHVEASGQVAAAGVEVARRLGTLGIGTATVAVGGDPSAQGALAGVGFERNGSRLSFVLDGRFALERFRQVGDLDEDRRLRSRIFAATGWNLRQAGTVTLAAARQDYWDAEPLDTLGLSYSVSLGRYGYLGLSASETRSRESSTEVYLSWTVPLTDNRTVNASLQHTPGVQGDEFEAVAGIQQALPPGTGVGYLLSASSQGNYQAQAEFQGRAGLVGAEVARRDGVQGWRLGALGGVAITDAGLMPSRTLTQSFAVVKVADYPGLTVMLDQQPIGVTDAHGRVLIDRVRPYELNQVSLDPREVPLDAELRTATMLVTPAWRSGPVVEFPIERVRAATLRLVLPDGQPVPSGALVEVNGQSFPVAIDGFLYVTGVGEPHGARVSWQTGTCSFELPPAAAAEIVDLGTITCAGGGE
jgi:outer membrane usher protein